MDTTMTGAERRKLMISLMRESKTPISGGKLGALTGVSRQVVVQDIALLRTEGYSILATARGYILDEPQIVERVFYVCHSDEQVEEEMNTVVDLGGCIVDVMVDHDVYGKVCAPLHLRNRRDVQRFMKQMESGNSEPLKNVTSNFHFHRVSAESEEILDEIESALSENGFLVHVLAD